MLAKKNPSNQRIGAWPKARLSARNANSIPTDAINKEPPAKPSKAIIIAANVTWIKTPVATIPKRLYSHIGSCFCIQLMDGSDCVFYSRVQYFLKRVRRSQLLLLS